MITTNISELFNAQNAFTELMEIQLPGKIAYQIVNIIEKIETEFKKFSKVREKLQSDLNLTIEDIKNPDEIMEEKYKNYNQYIKEIEELQKIEINIDSDLILIPNVNIKPATLYLLKNFITVEV